MEIKKWIRSAAGKVSVVLMTVSLLLVCLIFSSCGQDFLSTETANTINNILIGVATGLIGIVVTVSFVQYAFDKQNEEKERKEEILTIKRYNKYMQSLIQKFCMFYIPVTTRLKDRNRAMEENPFNHQFKFSDIADMYSTSMYVSESLAKPAIVLFYDAEERLREYMLRMLENVNFKYNTEIENILLEFVTKSLDLDVRGGILDAINTRCSNERMCDIVSRDIANEAYDWIGEFQRGKLKSNLILPYVLFYYNVHDQVRLLKAYTAYVDKLDCQL